MDEKQFLLPAATATAALAILATIVYQRIIKMPYVDTTSRQHGGELVARVLESHHVRFVFTLVGGHISPILVAAERSCGNNNNNNIRVIDVRHEANAVFAADAVARLTGTPGVAVVTAGPGLTNAVTAVQNAQMAESPLVLMGGAAATLLRSRGALQDIEQLELLRPLCKWTATVRRVRDIPTILRKAFQKAQEGTPGPVFVEFPIDTLYPIGVVLSEAGVKRKSTDGVMKKIVNWYIERSIKSSFHGAFDDDNADYSPLPFTYPQHTASDVARAVHLVAEAERPIVLLGSQATLPPTQPRDLQVALERMGIPCFLGGMCRGLLGVNSDIQITQKRSEALKEADVILLIGSVADFRLGYGRSFGRRAKVIAVNRNLAQLYKNTDIFWKATLPVQADPASFIVSLSSALNEGGYSVAVQGWSSKLRQRAAKREAEINSMAMKKTEKYANPLRLLQILDEVLDDDCIMVADGGDFIGSAAYILRPRGPLKWLDPGAFGTLGVGAGFAMGAKLVHPDKQVVILYGDGSVGFSIVEYDSFKRHNIPILSIVGNDACWTQIARDQVPRFQSAVACNLEYTNYDKVVEAFGGEGYVIKDISSARSSLKAAAQSTAKGQSTLVNAFISGSDFREGSISV